MTPKEIGEVIRGAREGKSMSQAALGAAIGISQASVQAIEKGDTARSKHLPFIAQVLGISPQNIGLPAQPTPQPVTPTQEVVLGPDLERARGSHDVPVLGISVGGSDREGDERAPDFWMNGEVVNFVARPRGLANAKNVFSVFVRGDSMWPRYEENDLVFLQKASPAIGEDVVIELHPINGSEETASFIKRLVQRRGSYIVVRQFNPDSEIEFSMKEIRNLYRVIPTKEWVG